MKSQLFGALCAVLLTVTTLSANAALITGPNGVYDTDLDITWLLDANAGAGSTFDDGPSTTDGFLTWANANAWAASLNIDGITGWRLPTTTQPDMSCSTQTTGGVAGQSSGTGCTGSEMGHLFNVEGITSRAPGPFSNVRTSVYWSGTEFEPRPDVAWVFNFFNGVQGADFTIRDRPAWAVHSGNVSGVIPLPGAVWLFGSGLLGLLGLARCKR